jgi:hypothetical protein
MLFAQWVGRDGDELKIAFVYNFTKFITWPSAKFADSAAFDICVFGREELVGKFRALETQRARDRTIEVGRITGAAEALACEVLYVEAASLGSASVSATLASVQDLPVLTISDGGQFNDNGGVIELTENNNKIAFSIDDDLADAKQLDISSRLLRLAR